MKKILLFIFVSLVQNHAKWQISALVGLYSYYRVTKSPEALLLIRAGITTVKHYLINFRRPGKTLEYFLYTQNVDDYNPARTIGELKWLSTITGDNYFRKMANLFAADSHIETQEEYLRKF